MRSRFPVFLLLVLAAFTGTTSNAQQQRLAGLVHDVHTFNSKILGQERTILVTLPQTYDTSDGKYPVIIMLDAHPPYNVMMSGILDQQAWGGKAPEAILVGIQNINRLHDLTPTATERATSGGGPKFLQFIETEVIPLIDKTYRTLPYRVFAGHSLGGLFVIYSFVEKPDLFNAYIAASPVLHWDNNYVIKRTESLLKQDKEWKRRIHVSIGNEPDYVAGFNTFQSLLKRVKPKDLDVTFEQLKEDNHGSVVLPAYYAGVRKVFEGWTQDQITTLAETEAHYRKLSDRLGFAVVPPQVLLNNIGLQLYTAKRMDEAIDVYERNAELHPNSPTVYDNLARIYEKAERLKLARDNFEKAYKMAEQQGNAELGRTAKANFERISILVK